MDHSLQMQRYRLALILIGIFLIVSAAFNVRLFHYATYYYDLVNMDRLDPFGLRSYTVGPVARNIKRDSARRVVLFGDSRAHGWRFSTTLARHEFINRGIGGQTTVQVMERYDEHVSPLQPDVVVVQVGVNDLKTIALFPERKSEIVSACKRNIRRIISQITRENVTAILTTIFPAGTIPLERQIVWSSDIEDAIVDVNAYLRTLQSDNVILMDAYALLLKDGELDPEFAEDELHLSDKGYDHLNKTLFDILKELPNHK
jgi:lysophospholipase L1-like esterase